MSITISNVIVVQPKGFFTDDMIFDIEFNCTSKISRTNWKIVYLKTSDEKVLADVQVGPIEVGVNRFVLRANPPKFDDIPPEELALTGIMLKAYYKDQLFFKVGYYVSNTIPEDSIDNPDPSKIQREILPDTTVFTNSINWD